MPSTAARLFRSLLDLASRRTPNDSGAGPAPRQLWLEQDPSLLMCGVDGCGVCAAAEAEGRP